MSKSALSTDRGRAIVGALVSAAFLWTLLLSVSPQLHARIHAETNRADHACAVTLIATGSYDHAVQLPLISVPDFVSQFGGVPALSSSWVQPLFFKAHVFAHAPPALA